MLREFGELHEDVSWGLDVGDGSARWNGVPGDDYHQKKDKEDGKPVYES